MLYFSLPTRGTKNDYIHIKVHEGRKSTIYLSGLLATPFGTAMLSDELFASKTHTNVCSNVDGLVNSTIEVTANKSYFVHY